MNAQEINQTVAEALGWTNVGVHHPPSTLMEGCNPEGKWELIENYAEDSDAMREAIRTLDDAEMLDFVLFLEDETRQVSGYKRIINAILATPGQWAKAFLRAKSKWKD